MKNQTLIQFVAAHGGRWSQAGRDLLERLAKLKSEMNPIAELPAGEAVEVLKDTGNDGYLNEWLKDAELTMFDFEACYGDCGGKCESCQEKMRDAAEARYDECKGKIYDEINEVWVESV